MAKNREPEKPVESESESGDDDEVSSEEVGSSDSDSEPEQTLATAPAPKKPQPLPVSKAPYPSSSSEEEDEESGSEPESYTEVEPNVKPLVSKPMEEPQKPTISAAARKPRSKPNAPQISTPSKATGVAKRPAEDKEAEAMDNKRSKKKLPLEAESSGKTPTTPNDDSKKQLFQRLWSEDDEIVVLKGMIDYAAKKKSDPLADLNDFHDFIKKNLHVDVTRTQLQNKIRRLKQKYENNKSKEKKGKERTFSKVHEQKAYDLSKMIWGSENDNGVEGEKAVGSPKENGTAVRKTASKGLNKVENSNSREVKSLEVANDDVEMMAGSFSTGSFCARSLGGMSMRERILSAGAEFFEGENKVEGHKEWMKLRVAEVELEDKKYDLMRAQARLVLNVLRSSDH
ncbi:probable transcription factor At1g11510 [Olea europaea subsp. europaea]|uniref:Probable transcription factor At1g11510 n=1 Tax=Olea europaea subsp. europaea TaxID=158383 RepID=A0A8S0PE37_OLEEU|nr:probable transcription factor At1g11510 [Olea europaea subsp. europaea]